MSVVRIVTRILPSGAQNESYCHLLEARDIDTPLSTEWSQSGDPNAGNTIMAETTFCKENIIPSTVDIDSTIASQCNSISGLVCLKKSRLRLTSETIETTRPRHESLIRISPEILDDGTPGGILLSIPLRISRSDMHRTSGSQIRQNSEQWHQQISEQNMNGNASWPSINSNEGIANSNGINGSVSDISVKKYFQDNKCLLCGFICSIESENEIKRHLETHLATQNHKCNICGKSFGTSVLLHYHQYVHRTTNDTNYKDLTFMCNECPKKFKTEIRLDAHLKTHARKKIKCPCCELYLPSYRALKEHMNCHPGELPYQCSVCFERFPAMKTLQIHQHQHNKKKFLCEVCGKGYSKQSLFKQHCSMHNGKYQFKCKVCLKSFNNKANLVWHSQKHKRKYSCESCGMRFKFSQHLKNHVARFHEQVLQTHD